MTTSTQSRLKSAETRIQKLEWLCEEMAKVIAEKRDIPTQATQERKKSQ